MVFTPHWACTMAGSVWRKARQVCWCYTTASGDPSLGSPDVFYALSLAAMAGGTPCLPPSHHAYPWLLTGYQPSCREPTGGPATLLGHESGTKAGGLTVALPLRGGLKSRSRQCFPRQAVKLPTCRTVRLRCAIFTQGWLSPWAFCGPGWSFP